MTGDHGLRHALGTFALGTRLPHASGLQKGTEVGVHRSGLSSQGAVSTNLPAVCVNHFGSGRAPVQRLQVTLRGAEK